MNNPIGLELDLQVFNPSDEQEEVELFITDLEAETMTLFAAIRRC